MNINLQHLIKDFWVGFCNGVKPSPELEQVIKENFGLIVTCIIVILLGLVALSQYFIVALDLFY